MNTRTWELSESMPESLKDSAASTWLSVAANAETMYVMEKSSGVTHSFDPFSKIWSGPYNLRPDRSIYFSTLSFRGDSLIMVGLLGDPKNVNDLKVWEIKGESLEFCREIGAIPMELVEELKGEGTDSINSIRLCSVAGFFYIYNPEKPAELLAFEVGEEGLRRCRSLKNAAVSERSIVAERMVVTCFDVDLRDLGSAVKNGNASFTLLN
ncbi:F-box protein [Corchorus olitorius]|uniref:F-box protein n=1 Tax=Corchorus olitorius TaxID=93759 RepID=A0A1R3IC66_9ROSI|nr:F-box protein [Corchorus olitorius]